MIRYKTTKKNLEKGIKKISETWLKRARDRTDTFKNLEKYEESSSIWGEIKTVFMERQHHKCAFCERLMGGARRGNIEYDVEHFRPKNSVKKWPTAKMKRERGLQYSFSTGGSHAKGYYMLAYHIFNYTAACKICNTTLKSNYFPIAGTRGAPTGNLKAINKTEKPLLIYPLGAIDTDPEKLITFMGIIAAKNYLREKELFPAT
ncbi:MAG: hypothetical protein GY757_54695 [bacterium]|nr:hypothetical protein [bacterium]